MGKYYKISPEWARKLNVTNRGNMHPDGWFLILPVRASHLLQVLPPDEYGNLSSLDEAVAAIGGVIYDDREAVLSMQGDPQFMMNRLSGSEPIADSPESHDDSTESHDGPVAAPNQESDAVLEEESEDNVMTGTEADESPESSDDLID